MPHSGIVCPLSMASTQVKTCHHNCKFLSSNGKCTLLIAIEKYIKSK